MRKTGSKRQRINAANVRALMDAAGIKSAEEMERQMEGNEYAVKARTIRYILKGDGPKKYSTKTLYALVDVLDCYIQDIQTGLPGDIELESMADELARQRADNAALRARAEAAEAQLESMAVPA